MVSMANPGEVETVSTTNPGDGQTVGTTDSGEVQTVSMTNPNYRGGVSGGGGGTMHKSRLKSNPLAKGKGTKERAGTQASRSSDSSNNNNSSSRGRTLKSDDRRENSVG